MNWDKIARWLPWNNPPAAAVLIALFIILFFTIRSCEGAETLLEGGAAILSSEYSDGQYLIIEERFSQGRYAIGLGIVGEQLCDCTEGRVAVDTNAHVFVVRNVFWKRLQLGLGAGYWQNTNRALGKHITFQLSLGVNIWKQLDIRIRHSSNAGSGTPNLGQDMIGVSWRFE